MDSIAPNSDVPVATVQTVPHVGSDKGKGNSVAGVDDPILNALQNISSQFQMFQQQAAKDRSRVGELFQQFNSNQSVFKKQKTPHKKNAKNRLMFLLKMMLCCVEKML